MKTCWRIPSPGGAESPRLCLTVGDITRAPLDDGADAVVTAANAGLLGGGGVDGAIHDAAGWEPLQQACQAIIRQRGPLEAGQAVVTPGFGLQARWIIHTVGPVWHGGGQGEARALRSCYLESLRLARKLGARAVAFPAISCGVYGYPVEDAATVALAALAEGLAQSGQSGQPGPHPVMEATMWLYSQRALNPWTTAAKTLFGEPQS